MERTTASCNNLQWENFGVYGDKPIEILGQLGFSGPYGDDLGSGSSFSKNPFSVSPKKDGISDGFRGLGSLSPYKSTYCCPSMTGTMFSSGASVCSNEPMIGLRLGRHRDYGDGYCAKTSVPMSSTATTKRTRTSYQNMQNPCCQVEGCNLDLRSAKDYHRRHRICESHSKSPKVIVGGMERRFCQQCSRFHDLSEFDDKKRSCRRRLSDHNARRRRLQPEALHPSPAGMASALYDRRQQNLFLNGLPISGPNSTWENMLRQDSLTIPLTAESLCFPTNDIQNSVSSLHIDSSRATSIQSSSPRILDPCMHVPTSGPPMAPNLYIAHSLLSPNSWSLNEAESNLTESQLMHGNQNSIWGRFQPNEFLEEEGPPLSLMQNSINVENAGPPQLQEFQLFKASYDSGCFYSSERN